jgi:hypothetical protein
VRSGADHAEIARRVASLSGAPERQTGALLKHLPAVIPVAQSAALSTEVQQLARLGVDVRTAQPSTDIVDIGDALRDQLHNTHQLVIWDATVGDSRTCHCHRCGHVWRTKKQVGERVPRFCPQCGSQEWSKRRLFKCGWCGHEFETPDLERAPEVIFPRCPSCGLSNWLVGSSKGLTRKGSSMPLATRLAAVPLPVRVAAPFAIIEVANVQALHIFAPQAWPLVLFLSFVIFGRPPRRSRRPRGQP